MKRRFQEFPKHVYGPHGASMIVTSKEDRPSGWTDTPARDDVPEYAAPVRPNLGRAEMKAALRAKGAPFDERAADVALWELLS